MSTQNVNPFGMILQQLSAVVKRQEIKVPSDFHGRAVAVERTLISDSSGLVNSILDYAIAAGSSVDYSLETSNANFTKILNSWMKDINVDLLGKIPTGINALSKQYFIERWKGSSFIVLRTLWDDVDGFKLPTKFWFVSGKDVKIVDENSETKVLGGEKYKLQISKTNSIFLPASADERIFIQKPFEAWTSDYPVPFLIKRGLYKNLEFLKLISEKGESIVARALEYLLLIKKGSEELAKLQLDQYTYTKEELTDLKDKFQENLRRQRTEGGVPSYFTNFDTDIQHLIPDYKKVLESSLFVPTETHILNGLGFITMRESGNSRSESILNPKAFRQEVYSGVNDFKSLMLDVIRQILRENSSRKKYSNVDKLEFSQNLIKAFVDNDEKTFLRSVFDRGKMSAQTFQSIAGLDYDTEVQRREQEKKDGIDKILYPPVIQNQVQKNQQTNSQPVADNVSLDKQGPEKKNYTNASVSPVVCIETCKKNKHLHEANIILKLDDNGDILKIVGSTNEVDGHQHFITNFNETEPALDGHTHKLNFEKADLSIDNKTKIIKYKNLLSQEKLLNKFNKESDNETS